VTNFSKKEIQLKNKIQLRYPLNYFETENDLKKIDSEKKGI